VGFPWAMRSGKRWWLPSINAGADSSATQHCTVRRGTRASRQARTEELQKEVAERKQAETEMRRAKEAAEEAAGERANSSPHEP